VTNPQGAKAGPEATAHSDELTLGAASGRSLFLLFFRQIISRPCAWMAEILDHYQAVPTYNSGLLAVSPLFLL
jgi:hypothetical protein